MAEKNRKKLFELLKIPDNFVCADCESQGPEWASHNIGIFLCTCCAGIHRNLGAHISKIKSIRLDNWDDSQVQTMENMGNAKAKVKYEQHKPLFYKRPTYSDVQILKEQWIRAKYDRQEFIYPDRQKGYMCDIKEGMLWKRGKEDSRFQLRKFVLNETEDSFKYFVKENRDPKCLIKISEMNATFSPEKIGNLNGLQLSYLKDGSTRNIYVYTEYSQDVVDWYNAIRKAKLSRRHVAFPGVSEGELAVNLTRDYPKEGWLYKTGPRSNDGFNKRWFTLDDRKLMYFIDPLDAYPKGEIFLGYKEDRYSVKEGVPPGSKDQGCSFTLKTPVRSFLFSADTKEDRAQWMELLRKVFERQLTPQESAMSVNMVAKRSPHGLNIFKIR